MSRRWVQWTLTFLVLTLQLKAALLHWNDPSATIYWGKKAISLFSQSPWHSSLTETQTLSPFYHFCRCRQSLGGQSIVRRFQSPVSHPHQWYRLQWIPHPNDVPRFAAAADWEVAWHGTKLEALYSTAVYGRLFPSAHITQGHRFFHSFPGIYLHRDKLAHKA